MRILLLTQWFDPEPTPKGLTFAHALAQRGHTVEVLTGFPNYPEGRLYPGYRLRPWQVEHMDGVRVVRTFLFPCHDRSVGKRMLNYGGFAASAALSGCALINRPDVVYVYHPPVTVGLTALALRGRFGAPFVYDIQDLWPDTLNATGMLENGKVLEAIDFVCRWVYRAADHIVVLSPGFKRVLVQRGIPTSRIDVIYNWCEERFLRPMPPDERLAASLGLAGRFNVMFAGNLGTAQALPAVLEAARLLAHIVPRIQLVFVGAGMGEHALKQQARDYKLTNVLFLPRRSMGQIAPLLNLADVLLVHLKRDPLFRITIPSKTQAYLAVGRPILMGVEGDASDLVHRSAAGYACIPEDAASIAEGIMALYRLPPEERQRMGENGRSFYQQEMAQRIGIDRFEQLFAAVGNFC